MYRSSTIVGVVVMAGAFTLGCKMLGSQEEAREEFSYSKPLDGKSELTLENINGKITITGVEGLTEVEIKGTKFVKDNSVDAARSHLGEIAIGITERDSAIAIVTTQPNGHLGRSYGVEYQIRVPTTWRVSVDNTNGDVRLTSLHASVKASITNGDLFGSGLAGDISAELVNGKIEGDMSVPDHGSCALSTTNGTIDTKVAMAPSATARMGTTNGMINLTVPQNTSANISAGSSVGKVSVANLQVNGLQHTRQGYTGETISGTLGSGQGKIDLEVTNGTIALRGI